LNGLEFSAAVEAGRAVNGLIEAVAVDPRGGGR
jgi:hypothetical protein